MVKQAIIEALSPVSIAYEDTWNMLSRNVEHCVAKVHHDFARAMNEERQRNHKLSSDLAYVKEERKALREETEAIRKAMDIVLRDNGNLKDALKRAKVVIAKNEEELSDLRAEKDSLAMELNIVRRANEQTMEELGKRKGEVQAMDYVDNFVGSMRNEFAKQMDLNLTSLFKDLHEQKTLRIQAEKRLEDAMGKMKAIADSVNDPQSSSSPCHSRGASTVIGTPAPSDVAKREYPSSSVTSPIILAPHFLVPSRPSSSLSLSRPSSQASANPPLLPASPISPERRSARIQPHHVGEPPLPTPPPSSGVKRSRAEYEAEEAGSVVDEGAKRAATRRRSGSRSVSTAVVDPVQPPLPQPSSSLVKMEDGEVDELEEGGEVKSEEGEVEKVEEVVMANVKVEECNLKTSGSHSLPAAPIKRKLLGINHIPLLFHVEPERLRCRMCLTLNPLAAKKGAGCFPRNSQWSALFDHCMREHPKACEDMEKLTPAQIAEMRARMSMGKS